MRGGKIQNSVGPGQGRNQPQNQRSSHIGENQLRSQQGYPLQNIPPNIIMSQPPRFMTPQAIPMGPRNRPNQRNMYPSNQQNNMAGYNMSPQNMGYATVISQDQYPMFRQQYVPAGIHPSQVHYSMQPTAYQPSGYMQQPGAAGYYTGVQPGLFVVNQPAPAPTQQQQPQPPQQIPTTATSNLPSTVPQKMAKRSTKIVIRDPKDNKDVTEEITQSAKKSSGVVVNARSSGTPPLANSVKSDSAIQATFAAQVAAAAAGERKNNKIKEVGDDKVDEMPSEPLPNHLETVANEELVEQDGNIDMKEKVPTETIPAEKTTTNESKNVATESIEIGVETQEKIEKLPNDNKPIKDKELLTERLPFSENKSMNILTHEKDSRQKQNTVIEHERKITLLKPDRKAEVTNGNAETSNAEVVDEKLLINETTSENVSKDSKGTMVAQPLKSEASPVINNVHNINIAGVSGDTTGTNGSHSDNTQLLNSTSTVNSTSTGNDTTDNNEGLDTTLTNGKEETPNRTEDNSNIAPKTNHVPDKQEIPTALVALQEEQLLKQEESVKQEEQPLKQGESVKQEEQPLKQEESMKQPEQPLKQEEPMKQPEQPLKQEEPMKPPEQTIKEPQQPAQPMKEPEQTIKEQPEQTIKEQPEQTIKEQQQPAQPIQRAEQLPLQSSAETMTKKRSHKQRVKAMEKKGSEGDLMDAYTDNPPQPKPVQEKPKPVEPVTKKVEKPSEEDLSWEDKGEKIGDEIKIETEPEPSDQPILKYERDFLLKFQYMEVCNEKPAGLPDIEVVLDVPAPKSRNVDFMPSYVSRKMPGGGGGGGGRRDSRGKTQPRKIITPVNQAPVELKKSDNRWVRPQEKEQSLSEEQKKTNELYRVVIAILNKLTPQKFKTLVEQIMALDIDTPARLEGVIDRIFEKAISEPVFSVAYANMCRCLFTIKVSDADGKDVSFRKLLLNRCQKEFEKEGQDEQALQLKATQLEGLSEEEKKVKKEEMDEEASANKRRMLGNIKFIGELFKLKLLTENIMHDCIFKLLRNADEESLESMCKLLFTIGKDLDSDKAKPRIQQYFEQIHKIIDTKKVSSRVCFMLRDVVDLRKNNWVPRREEHYNPKTIDQIHKEAKQEQEKINLHMKESKQKKGGGGRDSPKPGPGSDGWTVSTRGKPAQVDANKLKSMGNKRANAAVDDSISLGPRAPFGQWGRGSTGGMSTPPEQEPQGNRFSALSGGSTMPPYDPRKTSTGSRPSSGGSRPGDRRNKADRDNALDAVRSITKAPQSNVKPAAQQVTAPEKIEPKIPKEDKAEVPKETVSLSQDEMRKKTIALIDEYCNIEDMKEALNCFEELGSAKIHDVFVVTAVERTYEMKTSKARIVTGRLLSELLSQKKMKKDQFHKGLGVILEHADDFSLDYPKLWQYLAEIITPVVMNAHYTLIDLKPLVMRHLLDCGKAGILLAEILKMVANESKEKATSLWVESNISWSQVKPGHLEVDEFLDRKNITFLNPFSNVKKLLNEEKISNTKVFDCIEENFNTDKRKQPEFIYQLTSAVAESCITSKDDGGPDCCIDKLKDRKDILHKYLDNKHELELEVLYALQSLYAQQNKPAKMLSTFFNTLYDVDVITEDSFLAWKDDNNPKRQEAKGSAIQATSSFFDWLQSAPSTEEGNES